ARLQLMQGLAGSGLLFLWPDPAARRSSCERRLRAGASLRPIFRARVPGPLPLAASVAFTQQIDAKRTIVLAFLSSPASGAGTNARLNPWKFGLCEMGRAALGKT